VGGAVLVPGKTAVNKKVTIKITLQCRKQGDRKRLFLFRVVRKDFSKDVSCAMRPEG
jgi:hypothetical protein